MATIKI